MCYDACNVRGRAIAAVNRADVSVRRLVYVHCSFGTNYRSSFTVHEGDSLGIAFQIPFRPREAMGLYQYLITHDPRLLLFQLNESVLLREVTLGFGDLCYVFPAELEGGTEICCLCLEAMDCVNHFSALRWKGGLESHRRVRADDMWLVSTAPHRIGPVVVIQTNHATLLSHPEQNECCVESLSPLSFESVYSNQVWDDRKSARLTAGFQVVLTAT